MPKNVEVPDGRIIEFPDSMTDQQIDLNLRLLLAREQSIGQAEAGAVERSTPATPSDPRFYGDPDDPQNIIEAGKHRGLEEAAPYAVGIPVAAGVAALGGPAAASLLGRAAPVVKGLAVGTGVDYVGDKVEGLTGLPTWTSELLATYFGLPSGLRDALLKATGKRIIAPLSGALKEGVAQAFEEQAAKAAAKKAAETTARKAVFSSSSPVVYPGSSTTSIAEMLAKLKRLAPRS